MYLLINALYPECLVKQKGIKLFYSKTDSNENGDLGVFNMF